MERNKDTARKQAYNSAHYERIEITVPKGQKATVQAAAKEAGESVNEYTQGALLARMGLEDWPELNKESAED